MVSPMSRQEAPSFKGGEVHIYCPVCGHCGEIGCCGVEEFLNKHVRGKTNCLHEEQIIDELLDILEDYKKLCKEMYD